MKEFKCARCFCYLGIMEKGKVKKGAFFLCDKCMDVYKTLEDLANYKDGTKKTHVDMPEFMKDIFSRKNERDRY